MRYLIFIFLFGCSTSQDARKSVQKVAIARLDGSRSKGNIKVIKWRLINGAGTIETPAKLITQTRFTKEGIYYAELMIKDSSGIVKKDTVKITVTK